jgi:hypothetical protein
MKKKTWLTKAIVIILLTLLVWAGAGYAKELYQGRGNLEIDPEFDGFHSIHALILMSDGNVDIQEDATVGDGMTADIEASADGSYNSIHEVTAWVNASVTSEGFTQTSDMVRTHSVQATGTGMYVNNASATDELRRRNHIIILTNDYQ